MNIEHDDRPLHHVLRRVTSGCGTFEDALRVQAILRQREAWSFTLGVAIGLLLALLLRWGAW